MTRRWMLARHWPTIAAWWRRASGAGDYPPCRLFRALLVGECVRCKGRAGGVQARGRWPGGRGCPRPHSRFEMQAAAAPPIAGLPS
jgi:hypothetical protein